MTTFQQVVHTDPAYAVEGDFASANPRASILQGGPAPVAGAAGVIVGRFARVADADGTVTNGSIAGLSRLAFIHRDQPAIITGFLEGNTMTVPVGNPVIPFDEGDFWCRFAAGAAIGQKVYASNADGSGIAGGSTAPQGAEVTASTTNASPTLTVTAVVSGALAVGDVVTGAGIPVGTTIAAFGTGTGGVGTYTLSANATATATGVDVTAAGGDDTGFWVHSVAAAGELAMISDRPVRR